MQWYRHAHAKDMPLRSIARMIQTMLYGRRFFPYYVYNILGGIEEDGTCVYLLRRISMHTSVYAGTGAVYSFDPVGSYERETCRAAGPAQSLVQPFLDNQVTVPFGGTRRALNSGLYCVDLLQEPATCPRHSPSDTFTA